MGDLYKYRCKNFGIKAPRHFDDFIIFIEGKIIEKRAIEYKDLLEILVSKSNLTINKDHKLNKQQPTINIDHTESRRNVTFENNSL